MPKILSLIDQTKAKLFGEDSSSAASPLQEKEQKEDKEEEKAVLSSHPASLPMESELIFHKLNSSSSHLLGELQPAKIAQSESLLFTSLPNEKNFISWSQLFALPIEKLKPLLNQVMPRIEEARKLRELNTIEEKAINNSTQHHQHHRGGGGGAESELGGDSHKSNHFIGLDISDSSPEIFFERLRQLFGITSNHYLFQFINQNQKKQSLLITPYFFLHKKANHEAVFRLLIITHRFIYRLEEEGKRIGNKLGEGRGFPRIKELLQEAEDYEKKYYPLIKKILHHSGWDANKFMFGTLPIRVGW